MAVKFAVQYAVALLLLISIFWCDGAAVSNCNEKKAKSIAVIGAGASGLTTARHAIAQGHYVTVFEQNDQLGGVWVYTDDVGKMKNGLKVHTAMYKGLRCLLFPSIFVPRKLFALFASV